MSIEQQFCVSVPPQGSKINEETCSPIADHTLQGISRLLLRNLKLHIFSRGDLTKMSESDKMSLVNHHLHNTQLDSLKTSFWFWHLSTKLLQKLVFFFLVWIAQGQETGWKSSSRPNSPVMWIYKSAVDEVSLMASCQCIWSGKLRKNFYHCASPSPSSIN